MGPEVCCGFVWCSGFNLALTSFFLREGFALYAIVGLDGKIRFNKGLFIISVQCLFKILLILCMSSESRHEDEFFSLCMLWFSF